MYTLLQAVLLNTIQLRLAKESILLYIVQYENDIKCTEVNELLHVGSTLNLCSGMIICYLAAEKDNIVLLLQPAT